MSGNCSGAEFLTVIVPPVMALSAMKVTASWKSSAKVKLPPPSWATPCTVSRLVPMPSICAPSMAMKAQNSCTCGSLAAFISVLVPPAKAAHSTKFSVVVTLA